jgi:pSer/pThr/pTyr-binding forkhead associated (FHA) protein
MRNPSASRGRKTSRSGAEEHFFSTRETLCDRCRGAQAGEPKTASVRGLKTTGNRSARAGQCRYACAGMGHATLRVVGGPGDGRSFDVEDAVELGRGVAGSPELSDPTISRRHARLSIDQAARLSIQDLGSRNGTLVNGRLITDVEPLAVGDVIDLGDTTLEVAAIEPGAVAPPVAGDQLTRVRPAGVPTPAAEQPAEAARTVTRSRSIAAGLPVLSVRELVKRVRIRGAIAALAVAVALWVALYVQLKNGNDPGLKKSAAVVQPATTTTGTSTTGTSSTTTATTTKSS